MNYTKATDCAPNSQPNAGDYNPDPNYLRTLLDQITDPLLTRGERASQRKVAKRLGVSERSFREYLTSKSKSKIPYALQYALERLAK